jgi:hypothetical protein
MKIGDLVRAQSAFTSRKMAADIIGIILKIGKNPLSPPAGNWIKVRWFGYRGGSTTWEPPEAVEVISENR